MINFDSLCLKAFIDEYGHILESGRIQKIQQPTRREIVINFRSHGENHKLYININPKYPHLCILKNNLHEIKIPKQPPMFCMLLRKYLDGAKILQVVQPPHERIFEIHIESYNELGEKSPLILAIELMGKHSNVILYNCENNIILGCAHNVGAEKSKERELAGGMKYIYPQQKDKKNILKTTFEDFYRDLSSAVILSEAKDLKHSTESFPAETLNSTYFDISIPLAKELIKAAKNDAKKLYELAKKVVDLEIFNPSISEDGENFSLFSLDKTTKWLHCDDINNLLDNYFGRHVCLDKLSTEKSALNQTLNKEIKKLEKTIETHKKTLKDAEKASKYKILADILTTNIHSITMPVKSVTLENYYENNEPISIELNPEISLKENIQRYYKLYNKMKTAETIAQERSDKTSVELEYLQGIKTSVEQADKSKILDEIKSELIERGANRPDYPLTSGNKNHKSRLHHHFAPRNNKAKPQKEKIEPDEIIWDGYKIYIGKNNKQNDFIVSKLSSANDLWLHTYNIPGSHILIKMPPDTKNPPDSVLLKAAQLAAYYSQARNSVKVDVTCVKRKFLKKPPGANPGYVTYTNEMNIIVDNNGQKN